MPHSYILYDRKVHYISLMVLNNKVSLGMSTESQVATEYTYRPLLALLVELMVVLLMYERKL
jgi:hypothetical protein